MSLVESLQLWKEAVRYYNEGDFQNSLKKFNEMNDSSAKIMFNIGRVYMSLCELQQALQTFQLVIKKDEHLAVGHFMLGVVNLMCSRHSDALINFNETFRNLRESKFIDYKQLGMRYRLYKCEVLLNRAVCLSSLGYFDRAIEDLLSALQCKMEPRHSIIDISLDNLQNGHSIEFLVMDSIFTPPKSKTANLEKRDYLGKAQVVVDTGDYEMMETPAHLKNQVKPDRPRSPDAGGERFRVLYDFTGQSAEEVSVRAGDVITVTEKGDDGWFTMVTNYSRKTGLVPGSYLEKVKNGGQTTKRQALLTDLRKKETRQSLRRIQPPANKQLPRLPSSGTLGKPNENKRLTESPTPSVKQLFTNGPTKTVRVGGGNTSPKLPPGKHTKLEPKIFNPGKQHTEYHPKIHSGPPKFRRMNSLENLLGKSPSNSPSSVKRFSEPVKGKEQSSDSDNDGYEEIPEIARVRPYAVNDVISPTERSMTNGKKGPQRPLPPPKAGFTLKPRDPPPALSPRVPRANTVSNEGSARDEKERPTSRIRAIPKPVRTPPRPPLSLHGSRKILNGPAKEPAQTQIVAIELVVSTSLRVNPSTTAEEIQNAAREAITKNLSSNFWIEKDGKRMRLDDPKVSNILDLVKDGKLKVWCTP